MRRTINLPLLCRKIELTLQPLFEKGIHWPDLSSTYLPTWLPAHDTQPNQPIFCHYASLGSHNDKNNKSYFPAATVILKAEQQIFSLPSMVLFLISLPPPPPHFIMFTLVLNPFLRGRPLLLHVCVYVSLQGPYGHTSSTPIPTLLCSALSIPTPSSIPFIREKNCPEVPF